MGLWRKKRPMKFGRRSGCYAEKYMSPFGWTVSHTVSSKSVDTVRRLGKPSRRRVLDGAPERMTPAQLLGTLLAMHVIVVSFPDILRRKLLEEMQAIGTSTSNKLRITNRGAPGPL